jgi:hypothetical protein
MYDYQCGECGEVWTRIHQFDSAPPPCPECGNGVHSTDYHKDRPKDFNEFVNGKQDTDENA